MGFQRDDEQSGSHVLARVAALMIVAVWPLKAYTDPGSGLLIWQVVGAFFVGCVYQVRKFLIRIRKRK
jgi:hypothetical protein